MTFWGVISGLATGLSVAVKVWMFEQARQNYRRKSVSGTSSLFFTLGFASYAASGLAGIPHMTLPLLLGQGLGVIPSALIGWQIVIYKILPAHGYRMNE